MYSMSETVNSSESSHWTSMWLKLTPISQEVGFCSLGKTREMCLALRDAWKHFRHDMRRVWRCTAAGLDWMACNQSLPSYEAGQDCDLAELASRLPAWNYCGLPHMAHRQLEQRHLKPQWIISCLFEPRSVHYDL